MFDLSAVWSKRGQSSCSDFEQVARLPGKNANWAATANDCGSSEVLSDVNEVCELNRKLASAVTLDAHGKSVAGLKSRANVRVEIEVVRFTPTGLD
jgi:hypothetical protein